MATELEMLFRGFSEKDRDDFLGMGRERKCRFGEPVVRDETESTSLFVILEGEAWVWKGEVVVSTLRKGGVFGESVLFLNQHRMATVRAEASLRVLEFRRQDILGYFQWREERLFKLFVLNIVTLLLEKLRRANQRIAYLEARLYEQTSSLMKSRGAGV